jgi:DNA-damage-inducible protein D
MRDMQSSEQHRSFEGIRQLDLDGNEFWLARELAPLLEYQEWRNFLRVIDKAKIACEQSGHATADHFGDRRQKSVMPKSRGNDE